eukprot:381597-Pelagomonas_calceolata.AAC.5
MPIYTSMGAGVLNTSQVVSSYAILSHGCCDGYALWGVLLCLCTAYKSTRSSYQEATWKSTAFINPCNVQTWTYPAPKA